VIYRHLELPVIVINITALNVALHTGSHIVVTINSTRTTARTLTIGIGYIATGRPITQMESIATGICVPSVEIRRGDNCNMQEMSRRTTIFYYIYRYTGDNDKKALWYELSLFGAFHQRTNE
jgi:hypothetical protein